MKKIKRPFEMNRLERSIPLDAQPASPILDPPWTKEATSTLIEVYRRHECLWDRENPDYKNRFSKAAAMNTIYKALDCVYPLERIIRKLHNLRCQLNTEVRKVIRKRNEGQRYSSSWELFDSLIFMSCKEIPELPTTTTDLMRKPRRQAKQKLATNLELHYNFVPVKPEDLDDLIEVKSEVVESQAFYPFVQIHTDSSQEDDASQSQEATQAESDLTAESVDVVQSTTYETLERVKEEPESDIQIESSNTLCMTADIFVDEPMGEDVENEAFGCLVASKLTNIQSEKRRRALMKNISAMIDASIEEDEKEFFREPETDPLC